LLPNNSKNLIVTFKLLFCSVSDL